MGFEFAVDCRSDRVDDMPLFDHRIDQAFLLRPPCIQSLAGQHQGHGLDRIDQVGQAGGSAEARVQTESNLRQPEPGAWQSQTVIAARATSRPPPRQGPWIMATVGQESAARPSTKAWAFCSFLTISFSITQATKFLDIGADTKSGRFCRANDQSLGICATRCSTTSPSSLIASWTGR